MGTIVKVCLGFAYIKERGQVWNIEEIVEFISVQDWNWYSQSYNRAGSTFLVRCRNELQKLNSFKEISPSYLSAFSLFYKHDTTISIKGLLCEVFFFFIVFLRVIESLYMIEQIIKNTSINLQRNNFSIHFFI